MAPRSIRGRITAGYVLSFLLLLVVASVLFVSLAVVESRLALHSAISRFLETTLEMRRYEKNFLLYGKQDDLDAALQYASSARALLAQNVIGDATRVARQPAWLTLLAGFVPERPLDASPQRTARCLDEYVDLLRAAAERMPGDGAESRREIEMGVRDAGRTVTETAERLSSTEALNIQEMLRSSRTTLVVLVVVFLLGTALIARVVLLGAIRPLSELDVGMQRIAAGDYRLFPEEDGKGEIASMHRAFNRMIRENFEHREERLRSEKLASLGTMLAGIAHEINNPLSNISTSAEILAEENEEAAPPERRELIDQIIDQTDRATDIIRTVLDFTREARFELKPTNLLSAIRGAILLVRGQLPAEVGIDVDVPPDAEIMADKAKIQQAFVNLLANSIDALRNAGREGRIVVSARQADQGVELAFMDDGGGIPAHILDRIFDPFFTTKDVGHGTGLGLYLTHQIVEQHGGTIRAESEVGRGTTVTLTLPRREAASRTGTEGTP